MRSACECYQRRLELLDVSPDLLDWLGTSLEQLGDPIAGKAAHGEAAWRRENGNRMKSPHLTLVVQIHGREGNLH